MEKIKKASESLTVMTNIVLPNETNSLRNLFGGELLAKMDGDKAIDEIGSCYDLAGRQVVEQRLELDGTGTGHGLSFGTN